jgi:hypothetical protein
MAYFLRRSDGAGSSGPLSAAVWYENREEHIQYHASPRVGVTMRVGSLSIGKENVAWQTSPVEEILLEVRNYVRFRTANSIYEWWKNSS